MSLRQNGEGERTENRFTHATRRVGLLFISLVLGIWLAVLPATPAHAEEVVTNETNPAPASSDGSTATTSSSESEQQLQEQPQGQEEQSSTSDQGQTTSSPSDTPSDTPSSPAPAPIEDTAVIRNEDDYNTGGEQSEPTTSGGNDPEANASEEVILTASAPVSTQETIEAAATTAAAVATDLATTSSQLQEVTSQSGSLSTPTETVSTAVASAETSTSAAQSAVTALDTAVATAQQAQTNLTTAQEELNGAEQQLATATTVLTERTEAVSQQTEVVTQASAAVNTAESNLATATAQVDAQEVVVAQAQTDLTTAETNLANASTPTVTVIENYTDGVQDPQITTGAGASISGGWNSEGVQGNALYTNGSSPITIDPTVQNVTKIEFDVYAKNGSAVETIHYTDGTTGTGELENGVMSHNGVSNPDHTYIEVIAAPEGKYIDKVVISPDGDIYIIDNIRITQPSQPSDPSLQTAVDDAQQTLTTEQATLATLVATETAAAQDLDNAQDTLATEQATLTTLQTEQAAAQSEVTSATSAVTAATEIVETAQETLDTAVAALQPAIDTAQAAVQEAQRDVAVAAAVTSVAVASELSTELTTVTNTAISTGVADNPTVATALQTATTAVDTAIADAQTAVTNANAAVEASENAEQAATLLATAQVDLADVQQDHEATSTLVSELTTQVAAQTQVVADAQAVVDENTQQGLLQQVYNNPGQNAAPTINSTPVSTTIDTNGINEMYGGGGPAGTNGEDFAVVWTGQWTPTETGTAYVTLPADDGTRLYVNGQLVINDWVDKGGGGSTADIPITAGVPIDIVVEYYENGGGAHVQFLRYTDSGWIVIPGAEFSTSSATPEQQAALASADAQLDTLTQDLATAQATLDVYEDELSVTATNVDMYENEVSTTQVAETTAWNTAITTSATATQSVSEAQDALAALQTAVDNETSFIAAPTNVQVTQLSNGDVQITWTAPADGIEPERYAISWQTGNSGWGVATGNAGDPNALNTSIVLSAALFESTGGLDTSYTFSVRADHDSQAMYSTAAVTDPIVVVDPIVPEPEPEQPVVPEPEPEQPEVPEQPVDPEPEQPVEPEPEVPSEPEPEPDPEPEQPTEPEQPVEPEPEPETPTEPEEPTEPEQPVEPEPEQPSEPTDPDPEPVTPEPVTPEEPQPETPTDPEEPDTPVDPEDPSEPGPDPEEPVDPVDPEPETPVEPEQPVDPQPEQEPEEQTPVDPTPEPEPSPENPTTPEQVESLVEDLLSDGKLDEGEKEAAIAALVDVFVDGVPTDILVELGIDFEELPPDTPIELENGVVITAELADAFESLANPGELLGDLLTDPGKVLTALTNLGADMSEEVREEGQKVVVAAVIAGGIAVQAAAAAAAAAAATTTGSSSSSGGGAPVGREGNTRPRARNPRRTPRK